ncbi:MAG: hypothetical protein AAF411_18940 [Myxococcota bacterium]
MVRAVVFALVCSGCVIAAEGGGETYELDTEGIRVSPVRLTLDNGVQRTAIDHLAFYEAPNPFDRSSQYLPFEYEGESLRLETGQIAAMVSNGGSVGLHVGDEYQLVRIEEAGWETLGFTFQMNGRTVTGSFEYNADYHCPPFPRQPASPEHPNRAPAPALN